MSLPVISGIQQIGLGNKAVYETWDWYLKNLGFDMPVFDEAAEAALMLPYTEGQPRSRHAVLALNMAGGGGYEIWQYTSREGQPPISPIRFGDLGIQVSKIKSKDLDASFVRFTTDPKSDIFQRPDGSRSFYVKDPKGHLLQLVEVKDQKAYLQNPKSPFSNGGVYGAVIGVSQMDRSIEFYRDILGYDKVLVDHVTDLEDAKFVNGQGAYRQVVLTHSKERKGPFSTLLGPSEIELIQAMDFHPTRIFKDRMWGDIGYIHLCFDVVGMDQLKDKCGSAQCPFTVDSGDFDMGEAAGRFAYIEDPDGTLIEFVETYRIPLVKKINWFLDLRKRNRLKKLPKWMLKAMSFGRVNEAKPKD